MDIFRASLKVLKIASVNLFVVILLFVFLEIAVRGYSVIANNESFFRAHNFISPWITTYDYPPPLIKEDGKAYFRHRENPTPIEKSGNMIRIIAVGGSTTVNLRPYRINGIDYSIALETMLQAGNNKQILYEVLNAGGNAYSTVQSLINIELRLVEFNPDIIILMHNINDSSVNAFKGGATSDYSNKYLQSYYLNPELQGSLSIGGFLTQSRILAKFGLPAMLADKAGDINISNDYRDGIRLFKRNLITIAQFCASNEIELILLTQPNTLRENEHIRNDIFFEYNKVIAEVANDQELHLVDMFTKFGNDKKNFVDNVHYSPAGIERFAMILHSELKDVILKRIKKREQENTT